MFEQYKDDFISLTSKIISVLNYEKSHEFLDFPGSWKLSFMVLIKQLVCLINSIDFPYIEHISYNTVPDEVSLRLGLFLAKQGISEENLKIVFIDKYMPVVRIPVFEESFLPLKKLTSGNPPIMSDIIIEDILLDEFVLPVELKYHYMYAGYGPKSHTLILVNKGKRILVNKKHYDLLEKQHKEVKIAKRILREKGYGCIGLDIVKTVMEVPTTHEN